MLYSLIYGPDWNECCYCNVLEGAEGVEVDILYQAFEADRKQRGIRGSDEDGFFAHLIEKHGFKKPDVVQVYL